MKISFEMAKELGFVPDILEKVYSQHHVFDKKACESDYIREYQKIIDEYCYDKKLMLVEIKAQRRRLEKQDVLRDKILQEIAG